MWFSFEIRLSLWYKLLCAWWLYAERIKSLFKVQFSEKGSNVRAMEEQTYVFFVDFMDECEGIHVYTIWCHDYMQVSLIVAGELECTLKDILIFSSGSNKIPPTGFTETPTLSFLYSESSTFSRWILSCSCDHERCWVFSCRQLDSRDAPVLLRARVKLSCGTSQFVGSSWSKVAACLSLCACSLEHLARLGERVWCACWPRPSISCKWRSNYREARNHCHVEALRLFGFSVTPSWPAPWSD